MLQQNIVVSDILQRWWRRAAGCIISQCLLAVSSCQWPYFDFGFRYKKLLWWLFILNSFCLFSRWWHSECLGGSDILQTQTEHAGNLQLSLLLLHNFSAFLAFPSLKNCSSSSQFSYCVRFERRHQEPLLFCKQCQQIPQILRGFMHGHASGNDALLQ